LEGQLGRPDSKWLRIKVFRPRQAPNILEKGFASIDSYDTFAVLIFERFINYNINAYHSTTCEKRKEEIDV
jgi:hypothetical protein